MMERTLDKRSIHDRIMSAGDQADPHNSGAGDQKKSRLSWPGIGAAALFGAVVQAR